MSLKSICSVPFEILAPVAMSLTEVPSAPQYQFAKGMAEEK